MERMEMGISREVDHIQAGNVHLCKLRKALGVQRVRRRDCDRTYRKASVRLECLQRMQQAD